MWEYRAIHAAAREAKSPVMMNGRPRPREYARRRLNVSAGWVAARPMIAPRAAPTQGVHPAANATPNRKDVRYLDFTPVTAILCSCSSQPILMRPVRYRPKKMIISPPDRESQSCTLYATE